MILFFNKKSSIQQTLSPGQKILKNELFHCKICFIEGWNCLCFKLKNNYL